MSEPRYLFGHTWEHERERLAALQQGGDPFTIGVLDAIGVEKGWRCLEIGAGAGSITRWLCEQVGPGGAVVATDLEPGFLSEIRAPNLEIRRHDITADPLETGAFQLVFARKVLEHLPGYALALRKLVAAAAPGGWVVIEDPDLVSVFGAACSDPAFVRRAYRAFIDTMADAGYQPGLGLHLGALLLDAGLTQVQMRGRAGEWSGAARPSAWLLTFERIRERVLASGRLTAAEIDRFLGEIQSPAFRALTGIHFAAWGQQPKL